MKKVVLKVDLHDDKAKQKVMKTVSSISGIESIAIDMKDMKLTVIGDVDPIDVVNKLRKKQWYAEILTVGPWPEKKPGDQAKEKEKEKEKKPENKDANAQMAALLNAANYYNQAYTNPYYANGNYYRVVTPENNPNPCVIS